MGRGNGFYGSRGGMEHGLGRNTAFVDLAAVFGHSRAHLSRIGAACWFRGGWGRRQAALRTGAVSDLIRLAWLSWILPNAMASITINASVTRVSIFAWPRM